MIPRVALVSKRMVAHFSIPVLRWAAFRLQADDQSARRDLLLPAGCGDGRVPAAGGGDRHVEPGNEDGHENETVGEFFFQ